MSAFASPFDARPGQHPPVPLLDEAKRPVIQSGRPLSPEASCAGCHDTEFITTNTFHKDMNCFACHVAKPDAKAYREAFANGQKERAADALLGKTGIVTWDGERSRWNASQMDAQGRANPEVVKITAPRLENCGICHGVTHRGSEPVRLDTDSPRDATDLKGQIFSAQRLSDSAINLAGKEHLSRPWDIHAERLMECRHCHHAANNPIFNDKVRSLGGSPDAPMHLKFDARRVDFMDYLARPDHNLARGRPTHGTSENGPRGTMRRCEDCHDGERSHPWLPFEKSHFAALSCESCHVPKMFAPAVESVDETILDAQGKPVTFSRGIEGGDARAKQLASLLVTGYEPVWLSRVTAKGQGKLLPHNLVTRFQWVFKDEAGEERELPRETLVSALFASSGVYRDEVLAALDRDADKSLSRGELLLDTQERVEVVAKLLTQRGVKEPRLSASTLPVSLHHNVASGSLAIKECEDCHAPHSRVERPMQVVAKGPYLREAPQWARHAPLRGVGKMVPNGVGGWVFVPETAEASLYIPGHDRHWWLDALGACLILGTMGGVGGHATLRILGARKRRQGKGGER
jgi:hypothetical protein